MARLHRIPVSATLSTSARSSRRARIVCVASLALNSFISAIPRWARTVLCACGCGRGVLGRRLRRYAAAACRMRAYRRRKDPLVGSPERRQRQLAGLDVRYAPHHRHQICRDLEAAGLISNDPAAHERYEARDDPRDRSYDPRIVDASAPTEVATRFVSAEPVRLPEAPHPELVRLWERAKPNSIARRKHPTRPEQPSREASIAAELAERVSGVHPAARSWPSRAATRAEEIERCWLPEDSFNPEEPFIGFRDGASPEPGWNSGPRWPTTRGDEPLCPPDDLDPWPAEALERLLDGWGAPLARPSDVYVRADELGGRFVDQRTPPDYGKVASVPPCPRCGGEFSLGLPRGDAPASCRTCGWRSKRAAEYRTFPCARCGDAVEVEDVLKHNCEPQEVTNVTDLSNVERRHRELLEALAAIQQTLVFVAERFPDDARVRDAVDDFWAEHPALRPVKVSGPLTTLLAVRERAAA